MASSQVSSLHSDMAHHLRQVHQDLLAQNDRCRGEYAKRLCFAPGPAGSADRPAGHHLPPAPRIPHRSPGLVAAGWPALWSKRSPPTRSHLSGQRVAGGRTPRRSTRMLSAYVLILTEVGKVAHVAQALSDLDGVQLAEDITGPYDIIARVQASSLDQLCRLVASRIQVVDGVTRTLTCTVIRR